MLMVFSRFVFIGLTAFGCLTPSFVCAQESFNFRIGSMNITGPVPEGYCFPEGKSLNKMQIAEAIDKRNVTHLTLVNCAQSVDSAIIDDYVVLKTPHRGIAAEIERQPFLEELQNAIKSDNFVKDMSSGDFMEQLEKSFKDVSGQNINLGGSLRALGADDTCVYLGGLFKVENQFGSNELAGAVCMTTVGKKPIGINVYGPGTQVKDIVGVMAKAKAFAEAMEALPIEK